MPELELIIGAAMLLSLTVYVLTGGADFGAGIWDLLASGRRARGQRELIARAIAPIWEANHVWLIVVVVLLFSAFPPAFSLVMTVLHIPLVIMLLGIVLRGSAFVFRAYDDQSEAVWTRWSRLFAIGSVIAPFMLGVTLGAVASGRVRLDPATHLPALGFVEPWLSPFPFAVGLLTLALCAFLSAVYLTLEAEDEELQELFRTRAIQAGVAVGLTALLSFLLSHQGASLVARGIARSSWALELQLVTAGAAIGAFWGLWTRRFRLARLMAMAQTTFIVWGWGLSQRPYVVFPDFTLAEAAAPDSVLRAVAIALGVGSALLLPAFWILYTVFKGHATEAQQARRPPE